MNVFDGILIGAFIISFTSIGAIWFNSLDGEINIFGIGDFARIDPGPNICWMNVSKDSYSASDCLKIADDAFTIVCNDIFKSKNFCIDLWNQTEISFDPEKNECIMSIPAECTGVSNE